MAIGSDPLRSTRKSTVRRKGQVAISGRLDVEDDRRALEAFFWTLLPNFPAPPVLLRSRGGHFMDKPDNVISLINLATVRALEELWRTPIDPLRFRANFYIDGARPWEEFDWLGRDIRIGGVTFSVDRKNGRCGATNVNPVTGQRDLDIPGSLRAAFGHKNLGVYLIARESGALAIGDAVAAPGDSSLAAEAIARGGLAPARGRFICRGCYYIYDEAQGAPLHFAKPGTPFDSLASDWRCPDCGPTSRPSDRMSRARPSIKTSFGRLALRGPGNCSDGVAAVPACSYRLKCSSTRACAF